MKKIIIFVTTFLAVGLVFYLAKDREASPASQTSTNTTTNTSAPVVNTPTNTVPPPTNVNQNTNTTIDVPATTVIAKKLDTPWALAFLPDNSILVTERPGRVRLIDSSGKLSPTPVATISNAKEIGEGGLMGVVLHPDFATNNFVYFYYTYSAAGDNTLNRVVRMTYQNNQLTGEKVIIDRIPGASNHNGGRIKFGPDKFLYVATGDAQEPSLAQNKNSLAGKILRVTDEGKAAPGNAFNTLVYSYGHRNPQGLTWDSNTVLWSSEHGPSGGSLGVGNDEVNKVELGKNYGWPTIQGNETRAGMEKPAVHSGRSDTWAPAGAAIIGNTLYFGGLRGQALYSFDVTNTAAGVKAHFDGQYGRIREVIVGPDGLLYITTSNRDGRGNPASADDRVIKVNPGKLD